jgi:hypothetical protein
MPFFLRSQATTASETLDALTTSPVRSRPFLTRLTIAALVMLLLCLLGGVGLGWAVRKNPDWVVNLLGFNHCCQLRSMSVCTLGTLFPADSDGDGFADSVERYLASDPHNPLSHPSLDLSLEYPGFNYLIDFALQPGERRRIHARAGIDDGSVVFAPGMRLLLDPEPPALLCLPDGTPSADPLLVPVAVDGTMEFDLAIRDDAVPGRPREPLLVEARHPLSGRYAGHFNFSVVWRLPPLPCTVKEIPFEPTAMAMQVDLADQKYWRSVRLAWQSAVPSGTYYIEATRDQSGNPNWFLVDDTRSGEDHDCVITYRPSNSKSDRFGPIQFRIVPTKPIPPEPPDDKVRLLSAFRLRQTVPKQLFQFSNQDLADMRCKLLPVASIAASPESAKAILQNIIDTETALVVGRDMGRNSILTDVSQSEPTVCNGFYVFEAITQLGLRIIILDSAKPQAAVLIWGRMTPVGFPG